MGEGQVPGVLWHTGPIVITYTSSYEHYGVEVPGTPWCSGFHV